MFAGHFALAAAVKSGTRQTPLWALMLSTQLLDVAFVPLLLSGHETIETVEGTHGYGSSLIHAAYTHSLVGALLLALLAGCLAGWRWGLKSGTIIAGVTMSHWVLDLVVHREDLPLLPGNAGDLPLLGLGLWTRREASIALELVLVVIGTVMYARSLLARKMASGLPEADAFAAPAVLAGRRLSGWAGTGMGVFLALSLIWDAAISG
ncbi:permease [Cohnella sp. AR92]|uniref:permease n=1 Tax=Cohnella sp. AR92 TaxID=648716 RepID=UPI000F8DB95D|nr:permease [Cohnella sp. AR92]RUS47843.1 permease [Cohnella sp. AR92]